MLRPARFPAGVPGALGLAGARETFARRASAHRRSTFDVHTEDSHENPTIGRRRAGIDGGRTGDKMAAPDPAIAPHGTDEEAAYAGEISGTGSGGQGSPRPVSDTVGALAFAATVVLAGWR